MIVALDIATRCGWAVGRPGAEPKFGVMDFSKAEEGTAEIIARFRFWLHERCVRVRPKPTLLAFESPYIPVMPKFGKKPSVQMNANTLRRLLGMVGAAEAVAFELRIRCTEARPIEICKFFTGQGSWGSSEAKKAATIYCAQTYGWDVGGDDNAADALALWCFAEDRLMPEAADLRRRLRADRLRAIEGEGPLFRKESAPREATREAPITPPDEGHSSNGRPAENTINGEKNQSFGRSLSRKIA